VVLADNLAPTDPVLSSQRGGTMNLSGRTIVQDTTPVSAGILSNSGIGGLNIDTDSDIADSIVSVGPVSLRDRTLVRGNVTSASTVTAVNGAHVNGTTSENQAVQIRTVTISATFPSSSDNRTIDGDIGVLPPGGYGTFLFNSNGAVTLVSGTYFFDSIAFNSASTMRIDSSNGPVFVNVRSSFAFQRATQAAVGNSNLDQLRFVLFGSGSVFLEAPFTGTVVAPEATITMQGAVTYRGGFFGQSIVGAAGITYIRDPFPAWETPSPPQAGLAATTVAARAAPSAPRAPTSSTATRARTAGAARTPAPPPPPEPSSPGPSPTHSRRGKPRSRKS
jgi:hypothetical protein